MSVHILIDGYNLIRQSAALSRIDAADIQDGRAALLDLLAAYRKLKKHRITVVFDGMDAAWGVPNRDQSQGIAIVFSRHEETADQVIKRMGAAMRENAMVVTSDRDIIASAQHSGCAVISAPDFEEKLRMAALMDAGGGAFEEDSKGWTPTTRKKGPGRRLSKKQRQLQRKQEKL
ncbi:MAG: NYN domain-containing protein [Pseudomonadota bacterium]